MESKQKFLKAKFKDTKKIISFTESFENFLRALETSFKIALYPLESSSFSVSYLDDEEDLINIENGFDYQEALKFAENSNQNFLNFLISSKNQSLNNFVFKKDNKENFEFIESNSQSLKSFELQKSPQIEFLIPKGSKIDLNKIQKLEDLKFFVDENQNNFNCKRIKNKKNFRNEDTILSKSPEISIDLPKQISCALNKKENFEITYDSSNNLNFKEPKEKAKKRIDIAFRNEVRNENNFKLEKLNKKKSEKKEKKSSEHKEKSSAILDKLKDIFGKSEANKTELINKDFSNDNNNNNNIKINKEDEKEVKKEIKKLAKTLVKKAINDELRSFKKEIEADLTLVVSKHYKALVKKNLEATNKLSEIQASLSKISEPNKTSHLGFACKICNQAPLLGIRYKCSVCKDYDICEACEDTSAQQHPHPFIKIRNGELNPAFIKTILFEEDDNYNNNNASIDNNNNNFSYAQKNNYVEKYIDLDFNNGVNNNGNENLKKMMESYNYFNLEANNQMLNYLRNSAYSNMINNDNNNINNNDNNNLKTIENNSNCASANSNFNINNLFKPVNFTNFINDNNLNKNQTEEIFKITCLNANSVFEIKNSKAKEFKITLKLRNTGKNTIPRPCYLECVSSQSEISGKGIPIDINLKPGMSINLEVTLDIAGLRKGFYLSVWKMQTSQREFFGEEIPLKIKIEKTEDLKIKEDFIEKNISAKSIDANNNSDEKINLDDLLKRNKISKLDFPLKKDTSNNFTSKNADLNNSNLYSSVNSGINSSQRTNIISLEEYKKLKMLKKKNSENIKSEVKKENKEKKESVDMFALADEIIKKYPEKIISRKMLINALFRTGGNEKNSVEMATNESHNVCRHYNKHMFN